MTPGSTTSTGLKTFMVAGVLGALTLRIASAQGMGGGNYSPDTPREVVLRPTAVPYELEGINQSLPKENKPFLKEPEISPQHVFRGLLHVGRDTNNPVALIWDQPRQKLYL